MEHSKIPDLAVNETTTRKGKIVVIDATPASDKVEMYNYVEPERGSLLAKRELGHNCKIYCSIIRERCEKIFGLKRKNLGIIASSRATMYYTGSHKPVNIDNFRDLARQGVAIIIIEKEGIADLLYTFADKYGVAFVCHTHPEKILYIAYYTIKIIN